MLAFLCITTFSSNRTTSISVDFWKYLLVLGLAAEKIRPFLTSGTLDLLGRLFCFALPVFLIEELWPCRLVFSGVFNGHILTYSFQLLDRFSAKVRANFRF